MRQDTTPVEPAGQLVWAHISYLNVTLNSTGGIGIPLTLDWNLAAGSLSFAQSAGSTDYFDIDATRGVNALQSIAPGVYRGAVSIALKAPRVACAVSVSAVGAGVTGEGDWGANTGPLHPDNTDPRYVSAPAGFNFSAVRDHQVWTVDSGTANWNLIYRANGNQAVTEVRLWVMRLGDLPS